MSRKLKQTFNWFSLIGISFSLTNSWLGLSSSLVMGLTNGGPLMVIYGLIIAMFFALMSAIAISDFASILPNASGPCFWTLKLLSEEDQEENIEIKPISGIHSKATVEICSREISLEEEEDKLALYCDSSNVVLKHRWKKHLALATGFANYMGSVFTMSSVCASLSLNVLGLFSLMHSAYQVQQWHIFVTYEIFNILIAIGSCCGEWLQIISKSGLVISLFSYIMTFLVSIISRSFNRETPWPAAKRIFLNFENTPAQWPPALTFILGLINPCWAFAGIDSATHMVEDVGYMKSRRLVPKVLICNILLGFLTSFTYAIAMFYCVTDTTAVVNSILPIVEIYYQATGNKSLSCFMQSCCIASGVICGFSCSTWQNRILWSVSCTCCHLSGGESSKFKLKAMSKFAKISKRFHMPVHAHIFSHFIVLIVGCIFMGSSTAFNAIVSACISVLYLSYAVPCAILLIYSGRKKFTKRVFGEQKLLGISPGYNYNGIFASISHILTICWALFCLVMFAFPYTLPVTQGNMNYVSVVYVAVGLLILIMVVT